MYRFERNLYCHRVTASNGAGGASKTYKAKDKPNPTRDKMLRAEEQINPNFKAASVEKKPVTQPPKKGPVAPAWKLEDGGEARLGRGPKPADKPIGKATVISIAGKTTATQNEPFISPVLVSLRNDPFKTDGSGPPVVPTRTNPPNGSDPCSAQVVLPMKGKDGKTKLTPVSLDLNCIGATASETRGNQSQVTTWLNGSQLSGTTTTNTVIPGMPGMPSFVIPNIVSTPNQGAQQGQTVQMASGKDKNKKGPIAAAGQFIHDLFVWAGTGVGTTIIAGVVDQVATGGKGRNMIGQGFKGLWNDIKQTAVNWYNDNWKSNVDTTREQAPTVGENFWRLLNLDDEINK